MIASERDKGLSKWKDKGERKRWGTLVGGSKCIRRAIDNTELEKKILVTARISQSLVTDLGSQ